MPPPDPAARPAGLPPEDRRFRPPSRWRLLTARARALPDALLIGAQRAGTTSLFRALAEHPQIVVGRRKEVHFFDHDSSWERGLDWYRAHFPFATDLAWRSRADGLRRVLLEATPAYLFRPQAVPRIRQVLPEVKLLAVLRDPVERALSNWKLAGEWGGQYAPFEEEIEHELAVEEGRSVPGQERRPRGLLARGRYAEQLERVYAHFPRERVRVLEAADLSDDPDATLAPVFDFLGLAPHVVRRAPPENRSQDRSGMSQALRSRLQRYFEPHDARLAELLGRAPTWRR